MNPLEYRVGYNKEHLLRLKHAGGEPKSKLTPCVGCLETWSKVAVLHGHAESLRMFILEPSNESGELIRGDFYIKGNFSITRKINNRKEASLAWDVFQAV